MCPLARYDSSSYVHFVLSVALYFPFLFPFLGHPLCGFNSIRNGIYRTCWWTPSGCGTMSLCSSSQRACSKYATWLRYVRMAWFLYCVQHDDDDDAVACLVRRTLTLFCLTSPLPLSLSISSPSDAPPPLLFPVSCSPQQKEHGR